MYLDTILDDLNPWWSGSPVLFSTLPEVRRSLQVEVLGRVLDASDRRALVVYGPRQVGKTVLLQQVAKDLLAGGWPARQVCYFDFSDDRLPRTGISPREIVGVAPDAGDPRYPRVFLLDEVEHAAEWDRFLKQAVDRATDRFVLTSSAAAHLRAAGRESGAGRWDEWRLDTLIFPEVLRIAGTPRSEDLSPRGILEGNPRLLPEYLSRGGFPEHLFSPAALVRQRLRQDIADRAILRDLLREGVDVERVRRLFAYLAQNSGAVFNAAKVAEWFRAGGEDKTDPRSVREWLRILEETCLVVLVGSEARGARARLGERPRVYMADHGLVLAFAPIPDPLHDPDLGGRIHEAVVLRHLRTIPEVRVGYCRPGDDLEADFAVSWPGRAGTDTVLVEVTASRSPRPEKVARLARLAEEHRIARAALIYGGVEPRAWGSVTLVPLHEVLLDPRAALGGGGEATP